MSLWNTVKEKLLKKATMKLLTNATDKEKVEQFNCAKNTFNKLSEEYSNHSTHQQYKDYIDAIKFFMSIVRDDFVSSVNASHLFYGSDKYEQATYYFPFSAIPENYVGSILWEEILASDYEVPLTTPTISIPWDVGRLYNISKLLENSPFVYHAANHASFYLKEMDLLIVCNGRHSLFYGFTTCKDGKIPTRVISLKMYFGTIDTDGAYWFMKNEPRSKKTDTPVLDVRVAILFYYARAVYYLENN